MTMVVGFPRSGNHLLRYALELNYEVNTQLNHGRRPIISDSVYIVRDVRDVILEFRYLLRKSIDDILDGNVTVPKGLNEYMRDVIENFVRNNIVENWKSHVQTFKPKCKTQVRYEDLINKYDSEILRVGRDLQLKPKKTLTVGVVRQVFEVVAPHAAMIQPNSWKDHFTSEQNDTVWQLAGETLESLGYEK